MDEDKVKGVEESSGDRELLASRLRDIRQFNGYGSLENLGKLLNTNKNTVGTYERAVRLPDVDYLAKFAEKTESDFIDLLILRLQSSAFPEARNASDEVKKYCIANKNNDNIDNTSEPISFEDTSDKKIKTGLNANNSGSDKDNEGAFRGIRKLLLEQYCGNDVDDKNMIIKILLKELICGQHISDYAFAEINKTLKKLDEIDNHTN